MYEDQQQTRPYGNTGRVFLHQFKHGTAGRGSLAVFAAVAGLLGLALGVIALALLLSYRGTATAQIRQLQQAVASAQAGNASTARSLNGVSGRVSGMASTVNAIAQFDMACSQALTTSNGTGEFYFPCTDQKP
jgi:hypothetical protein